MKSFNLATTIRAWLLVIGLVVPLAAPALAQNNTSSQGGGGASSTQQSTRTTTTTTTSQPTTQTTRTWVDPLWLILGGIALLAILLIVILAARGRSRDRVATVHERETVVKKE
jgi:beta-lactamase regulating signal transducer with metallopeptidase domain